VILAPNTPVPRRRRPVVGTAAFLALVAASGCAGVWAPVRRHEQAVSWERAVELAASGHCEEALASMERAQVEPTLTRRLAAESTFLKARCLESVGRIEESKAHYRFLRDFLSDSPHAASIPAAIRDERVPPIPAIRDERVASIPATRDERVASIPFTRDERVASVDPVLETLAPFDLPPARYSRAARKAGLHGRVELYYEIADARRASSIRVVRDAHPLLASWAIEALAAGRLSGEDVAADPSGVVVFRFESRKSLSSRAAADRHRRDYAEAASPPRLEITCTGECSSPQSPG
jgi:hypothetical protein